MAVAGLSTNPHAVEIPRSCCTIWVNIGNLWSRFFAVVFAYVVRDVLLLSDGSYAYADSSPFNCYVCGAITELHLNLFQVV